METKNTKSPTLTAEETAAKAATAAQAKAAKDAADKAAQEKAAAEKAEAAKAAAAEKLAKENAAKLEKSRKTDLLKHSHDTYVPEPGSESSYHARVEVKSFDKNSGERQSKPQLQMFSPKAFANFERNSANLGYTVDILHDPTGEYPTAGVEKAKAEAKKKDAKTDK